MFINLRGSLISLGKPVVMGILNITEDSFYDGGRYITEGDIIERAEQIIAEGATIIDLGAMSTRPGAAELPEETELKRVVHAVSVIRKHIPDAFISVDTWRASVAQSAVDAGAAMVNDISGGTFDCRVLPAVAQLGVPYCLTHTSGKPDVMQKKTHYDNIIGEMLQFFGQQIALLKSYGANDIIIDPGFGFGKTVEQNFFIMNNLQAFEVFGLPLLVGISRKSMIYKSLGGTPETALNGTTALNAMALMKGADILRVHDVAEACETIHLFNLLNHENNNRS